MQRGCQGPILCSIASLCSFPSFGSPRFFPSPFYRIPTHPLRPCIFSRIPKRDAQPPWPGPPPEYNPLLSPLGFPPHWHTRWSRPLQVGHPPKKPCLYLRHSVQVVLRKRSSGSCRARCASAAPACRRATPPQRPTAVKVDANEAHALVSPVCPVHRNVRRADVCSRDRIKIFSASWWIAPTAPYTASWSPGKASHYRTCAPALLDPITAAAGNMCPVTGRGQYKPRVFPASSVSGGRGKAAMDVRHEAEPLGAKWPWKPNRPLAARRERFYARKGCLSTLSAFRSFL